LEKGMNRSRGDNDELRQLLQRASQDRESIRGDIERMKILINTSNTDRRLTKQHFDD
jgi:hypothetical protein